MSWAVAVAGRADPAGVLLIVEERTEAESLAAEIRRRGTDVIVRLYPAAGGTAGVWRAPARRAGAPRPARSA